MKYRNLKPYLTYALNKDGDLVHIDSVPNGNKCACFCPHCKSELCAKNGGLGEKKFIILRISMALIVWEQLSLHYIRWQKM